MSCPCHTRLLLFDPAFVLTMLMNKDLQMDPNTSSVPSVTHTVLKFIRLYLLTESGHENKKIKWFTIFF